MSQVSATRKRAQERRSQRRRQSNIRIMIGIGVAALVLAGVLILVSLQGDFEAADYSDLEQTVDESFGAPAYSLGDPDAPVTLVDYSDFSCPHCRTFAPVAHAMIDKYVRDGQLRIVYVPVSFLDPATSGVASTAMVCAGAQGKAWEMHDQIWALRGPGFYTRSALTRQAEALGLDTDEFADCFDSPETAALVEQINQAAAARGVSGTPTIFVNDVNIPNRVPEEMDEVLSEAIDIELAEAQ